MYCIKSKKISIFLVGILIGIPTFHAFSQSNDKNPVELIERESEGAITIEMPPAILNLILKNDHKPSKPSGKGGVTKVAGYRIQVFCDGRNQNSLESRAKARGNTILSKFPKYKGQIYTFSSSPNWFTRIGNFRTNSEASAALSELKKAFPSFASEMRIVKSQIIVTK